MRGHLVVRRGAVVFHFHRRTTLFRLRINRNILLEVALEPAAVVQRFANGDAVKPGLQRTAAAETPYAAKCLQENFLRRVGGVGRISQHAQAEAVHGTVIMGHQPVECRLRARLQLADESGFIVAPREGTSPIGHGLPFWFVPWCWMPWDELAHAGSRQRGRPIYLFPASGLLALRMGSTLPIHVRSLY